MIEVELPDGTIAEFPDGTSQDVIRSALQRRFGGGQPAPERPGLGRVIWENVVGDNDPNTQNFGEKVGTWLNKAGESATFGLVGDEASGALAGMIPGGMNYEQRRDYERQQERLLEQTNPGAALTADVGGAIAGALTPAGAIGTLGRGAGLMPRIAASMAAGAGMGATSGFTEGEGVADRLGQAQTGAVLGAGVGAVAPVIGAGVQKVADALAARPAIRSAPDMAVLRGQANALYAQADQAAPLPRSAFAPAAAQIVADAQRSGMDDMLTPGASRVASRMDEAANSADPNIGFRELDILRRQAGIPAGNIANRTEAAIGSRMAEGVDDFIDATDPQLSATVGQAREIWGRLRRSELIEKAIEKARNQASGFENGLRTQFRQILNNPRLLRGFRPDEVEALKAVVRGTPFGNILRQVGRLGIEMGSGSNALGAVLGAAGGGAMFGPAGSVIVPVLATAARKGAEKTTERSAEVARAIVARGQSLPVASDSARRITEALMRRTAAAGAQ